VDSPLQSLEVRPWRTATLVASAVAALELVLLVVAAVALFARPLSHHVQDAAARRAVAPKPPPARAEPAKARKPSLTRSDTSVLILNGNGVTGAAAAASDRVRKRGYLVASVGDAGRTDYPTSVVMYRPGFKPEGIRLARDLQVRVVGPLDGVRVRDLMGAHVALVLGH
jgi:LytR cell envelope-related transcriptional attenuator